jgi:predicted MPP superfamily phosphohydrolase
MLPFSGASGLKPQALCCPMLYALSPMPLARLPSIHRRTFLRSLLAAGAASLAGCSAYAYRSTNLEVRNERIAIPGLKETVRVVSASDLHMPCFYTSTSQLINTIIANMPDIFILAGDTIDNRGNEKLVSSFEKVRAKHAKLAVLGNWEYQGQVDLKRLKGQYQKSGFSLLLNKAIEVDKLIIVGLDDFLYGSPDYHILNQRQTSSTPLVVLSHCPESFDYITDVSPNPTITISGHTHGGQIAPLGIALHTPVGSGSYVHGWYRKGEHSMYVMRGIGTSGIPLRIGARPELLVLDLIPAYR